MCDSTKLTNLNIQNSVEHTVQRNIFRFYRVLLQIQVNKFQIK